MISFANSIGLEVAAITNAGPLYELAPLLRERFDGGRKLPFEKEGLMRRIDPRLTLPQAQSIICLALPYLSYPENKKERESITGKFARIARIRDYHLIFREKAEMLVSFIKANESTCLNYNISCDTSPLVERGFFRKGKGLTGRNGFYYSPAFGSWVALGLIITDLPLSDYSPLNLDANNHCEGCNLCLKSCPTKALTAPFKINPIKCISYLTQGREIIPRNYRSIMGNTLYGCDICQEVCPLNRVKDIPKPPFLQESLVPEDVNLLSFLRLSKKEFNASFGKTSAAWRGLSTLKRNAIIALGNSHNPEATETLKAILTTDPLPQKRLYAAWALGEIDCQKARDALSHSFNYEKETDVKKEIATALEK